MKKIFGIIFGVLGVWGMFNCLVPERAMAWSDPACDDMTAEEKEIAGCGQSSTISEDSFVKKVAKVLNTVLPLAVLLAVVMIVVAGIMMSVSMGDAGKVKKAKSMMIYALVGMVVALLAYAIVSFVLDKIE